MAASRRARTPKEPCVVMDKLLHRLDVRAVLCRTHEYLYIVFAALLVCEGVSFIANYLLFIITQREGFNSCLQ